MLVLSLLWDLFRTFITSLGHLELFVSGYMSAWYVSKASPKITTQLMGQLPSATSFAYLANDRVSVDLCCTVYTKGWVDSND